MHDGAMPRRAYVPRQLRLLPFRGSEAIAQGLLTRSALRGKAWRRVFPDTYLPSHVELDYRMSCWAAAVYIGPSGAIAGVSAAFLHGIEVPRDDRVHVITRRDLHRSVPDKLHAARAVLAPGDVVSLGGVRVTSAVRTCFDLARQLSLEEAVVAIDEFCFRRVVSLGDLIAYADARRRWPGSGGVLAVLGLVEPKSESPMETRLRLILVDGGLPRPLAQHEVRLNGTFIARVDLAYPEWKIAIEYDGDHHRDREAFARDLRRQNRLIAAGWTILRFTATDIFRNQDGVVAQVRAVIPEPVPWSGR